MADQKPRFRRKKPSEKTTVMTEKVDITSGGNELEIQELVAENAELERNLSDLTNRLSSAISESYAKDDLVKKHSKIAQDALAGWEKAEAKALSLRQELDEAWKQRENSEDMMHHLEAALEECMMQLHFLREDQGRRIHDVLLKASGELEETKMFLEDKLVESRKKTAKLTAENSQLNELLFLKDKLIDELNQQMAKAEGDLKALLGRMEIMEKESNSLIHEVCILEKEVDIRNQERELNRRGSDAAHKQHLENEKKIVKLESECQKLRFLVRKRLPGPADLAKMKSEVGLLQRDSTVDRKSKWNSNVSTLRLGYIEDGSPESPLKKINFLTERISTLEEENYCLRETIAKKNNEIQVSKLSEVETHSKNLYSASMSDVGSDDKVSCVGSWASGLISEFDQFKEGKDKVSPSKSGGWQEINRLMNDFLEMEKLALVCVDKPSDSTLNFPSETTGKELVPVSLPSTDDSNIVIVGKCEKLQSDMSISISKLIEIIEEINLFSHDNNIQARSEKNETSMGYLVRVFQWKTSELALVLRKFLHTCEDLLHGRTNFEKFIHELTISLEWIISHCFSLQEVSCMNDALKKKFDYNHNEMQSDLSQESEKLKDSEKSMNSRKLEQELQSAIQDCESLREQLRKSETIIASLEAELKALTDSKVMIEDQLENHKMTIDDLNSQLKIVMSELEEANQKFTSQEEELKNKVKHCEGLESKCRDLQLQFDRVTKMDTNKRVNQEEKQLRTEREISAASEKLAECQETILHLGKQIKALTPSRHVVVSDKFISTPTNTDAATTVNTTSPTTTVEKKITSQRSSLLDKMLAEDGSETDELESPKTKELICSKDFRSGPAIEHNTDSNVNHKRDSENHVGSLAIIPVKKQVTTSSGLFKKLLWSKKKGSRKNMPLTFGV